MSFRVHADPGAGGVDHGHQPVEHGEDAVLGNGDAQGVSDVHAAGVPGNQSGGDGAGALKGRGQDGGVQAHLAVLLGVHTAGNHDGDVLLGHGHVGQHAGDLGDGDQTSGALGQLLELVDHNLQLVGALHNAAEHHGDDGHGHGVHHAQDTAALQQLIHGLIGLRAQRGLEQASTSSGERQSHSCRS